MSIRATLKCTSGATMAEFALVLPLLLIMLFGIIDVGRLMWTLTRGEKAAQAGARFAVVTDIVPAGLQDYSFVSDANPPGSPVAGLFGSITCEGAGGAPECTCTADPCTDDMLGTTNASAFNAILARMRVFYPELKSDDLKVVYEGVGLGYAGNPYGSDVSPMVSLEIDGRKFRPITLFAFGSPQIALPPFKSSMTLEDGSGTISN
jgi:hypothetical protein